MLYSIINHLWPPTRTKSISVTYYSQWESPQLVSDIIKNKIQASQDPNWKLSGARTKEEYQLWSWNVCGMACLKMVLSSKSAPIPPILILAKSCLKYGGYKPNGKNIDGLFYHPFVKFIHQDLGIRSFVPHSLDVQRIIYELNKNHLVIASVHPSIRNNQLNATDKRGGHLVLINGYDLVKKTLSIQNPSGIFNESQSVDTSFNIFESYSSHRGIVII